ncbi:MAG: acyltransferase family protein [Bradyrhizobium sp.]
MNIKADVNAIVGEPDSRRLPRNRGLDALRATMTLLVLFHHSAITYGAIGGWFYREIKPHGSLSSILLVLFCTVNQAYFMGLFFLLAGHFTPAAIRGKKPWLYLRDRMLRLGIPLLLFGWILGPVTIALAGTSEGRPFTDRLLSLWRKGGVRGRPALVRRGAADLWYRRLGLVCAVSREPRYSTCNSDTSPATWFCSSPAAWLPAIAGLNGHR